MIILLVAAVGVIVAVALAVRSRDGDLPEWIVATATDRLPDHRRAWGAAMAAELAAVPSPGHRWRFAAAVLRVALLPPARKPATFRVAAAVGTLLAVGATVATTRLLPTLSVFVAVLGLLMAGCVSSFAARLPGLPATPARLATAAMPVTGVLAAVAAVSTVAATHPAATRDPTHVYSVVLALVLGGYLVAGLSMVTDSPAPAAMWGGVAGACVAVAVSTVIMPAQPAVVVPVSPVIAAATLATTVGVAGLTGSRPAATRAGLLVAVLGAPVQFAIAVVAAGYAAPSVLTDPYDIAAYPRSGYPDVASYLLSDTLGGDIVVLTVTPLAVCVLAMSATALMPGMPRPPAQATTR
jgi:hypothetical protein